jgi:hypothetical protein
MSGLEGLEFELWQGYEPIHLSEMHRLTLQPTQPHMQLVPGSFLGSKAAGGGLFDTRTPILVSKIKTVHLLIPYAFLAWTGTPLPLPAQQRYKSK